MNDKEQNTLLELSRRTLQENIRGVDIGEDIIKDFEITESLKQHFGAFVTLKIRGALRGCIGYIESRVPLYQAVIDNTISASRKDPRFSPVTQSEVAEINIEISVLSPLREIPNYTHFEVGKHGIILKKGVYSSVFLPQVAPEQGWSREDTLYHLSRKAGLEGTAWERDDVTFEVFTAQVFHEKK